MLYIHIPFCRQACSYCDFHFSTTAKYQDEMWQALQREVVLSRNYLTDKKIKTIYFGGGTPSLMPIAALKKLLSVIEQYYDLAEIDEITLEANPDDLTKEYLNALKSTPINRLSIGIQSFIDDDLKMMNRAHNAKEADYCIKLAQDIGFENLSCDLIFGTPTLTDEGLKSNILRLVDNKIPHIAAYSLTVEEKTALNTWVKTGKIKPKTNEAYARQMLLTMNALMENGYEQYEISNYAKNAKYAIHNTSYWRGREYLGIGPSAHSYDGKSRRWNVRSNPLYLKSILQDEKIPYEEEILTQKDVTNETIMTRLRTMWGLDLSSFETKIKDKITQSAIPFINEGSVLQQDDVLFLSASGKLIADHIASELFVQ